MKKITEAMLSDIENQKDIQEYINSLEEEIEQTEEVEKKLDVILSNILAKFDDFKDFRSIRASNMSAINELIRTKKDFKDTKLKAKKDLLDVVMKKRNTDAKNKTMLAVDGEETKMDYQTLLIHLDKLNIHPVISQEEIKEAEYLIDSQVEQLAISDGKEKTEENSYSDRTGNENGTNEESEDDVLDAIDRISSTDLKKIAIVSRPSTMKKALLAGNLLSEED